MSNEQPQRPTNNDDRDAWRAYWKALDMPWRTEPEVDAERQASLAQLLAIKGDIERGVYPFKGVRLTRADVEWLLVAPKDHRWLLLFSQLRRSPPPPERADKEVYPPMTWRRPPAHSTYVASSPDPIPANRPIPTHPQALRPQHNAPSELESPSRSESVYPHTPSPQDSPSTAGVAVEELHAPAMHLVAAEEPREELDLRGADLHGANLQGLPLIRLRGGLTFDEWHRVPPEQRTMAAIRLDGAVLSQARLDHAILGCAHLEKASLYETHVQGADLSGASLQGARLYKTHLEGADLYQSRLEGARLYQAQLQGANLRRAYFDSHTTLDEACLTDGPHGSPLLADVQWGGANLTVVAWESMRQIGDEREARKRTAPDGHMKDQAARHADYMVAVRAYRQLATALRNQGLNEQADCFAYRAQVLQRQVLRRQGQVLRYLGSLLLDLIAGYGYRPLRSFATYLLVVIAFAGVYLVLGGAHGQPLSWNESLVVSLTAFHGRGFFATAFQPGDPQAAVAAIEAVFGLVIEITFIATFTQRFFAR
jgi:uncharacterized protein YjbI with pentapeptide repeats